MRRTIRRWNRATPRWRMPTSGSWAVLPARPSMPVKQQFAGLGRSLQRIGSTALLETRLNLASPGPWIVGGVLAALGYLTVRTAPDASSFPLAWGLSHDIGPLALALLLFMSA